MGKRQKPPASKDLPWATPESERRTTLWHLRQAEEHIFRATEVGDNLWAKDCSIWLSIKKVRKELEEWIREAR